MTVGFVDLNESPLSFSVAHVCIRVILNGKAAVGSLNIGEASSAGHTKNLVVGWLAAGIVLLEESLLLFILHSVLIEELLEELVGIVDAEMLTFNLVVVMTLTNIR